LKEIHEVLSNDGDVSKKVKYHVKERGENDRNRLAKLFQFKGPDQDTQVILRNNFEAWKSCPESFWIGPVPAAVGTFIAEAEIVGSYIQTKRGDA